MEVLAINGGEPVRKKPFPTNFLGVSMYDDAELTQVSDVIRDKSPFRHYGIGSPKKAETFEKNASAYFGRKFALALSSGTGALFCSMAALGIGPGDEVILPSFDWFSDFFAITQAGALPVFADIDETLNLDPEDFEKKITENTKAAVVVDFQGCPARMDRIMSIAGRHGVKVIEDIAQAIGGVYGGKKLGAFGHIAVVSFQINKMLSCGDGGLLLTDNEEYFERAVRYHDLGIVRPVFGQQIQDKRLLGDSRAFAGNQYRMNELSAAVMIAQLGKLEELLRVCRSHHSRIRESFKNNTRFAIRWVEGDCGVSVFMIFKSAPEAIEFERRLSAEGIPLGPKSACRNLMGQYPIISKRLAHPSLPPYGKGFNGEFTDYAKLGEGMRTDDIVSRLVAISIGPQYTEDDISDIIHAVTKVCENLYGRG